MGIRPRAFAALALPLATAACSGFFLSSPRPVSGRIVHPQRDDARLAVLWVGHATTLVQMDDKFILTDPFFTSSVGLLSVRLQQPGLDPANVPPLDAVVISHMHFDHLSLGSLDLIEPKVKRLYVPRGGTVYVPNYDFAVRELATWASDDVDGLRITAVPVKHVGFRYGVDAQWMTETFTGYVFEYHGLTVYFAGDTAYDGERFRAAADRFPSIDLALMPIAPIHPRDFMSATHVDPPEAIRAFLDLGAKTMVAIHHDTVINSTDAPGEAVASLQHEMQIRGLSAQQVRVLPVGGQAVIVGREGGSATAAAPAL
jgi:L-ascorbate metabolism protein UlaG (beta-lactamase superfamily)